MSPRLRSCPQNITAYFLCCRCFHYLLAALFYYSHFENSLHELRGATGNVQCLHLAGICEQRRQPHHIYHFQCGVQKGFHKDIALLRTLFIAHEEEERCKISQEVSAIIDCYVK